MFIERLNKRQLEHVLTKILYPKLYITNIDVEDCDGYLHIEFDNNYDNGDIVREEINLTDFNSDWIAGGYIETTVAYRKYMYSLFGDDYAAIGLFQLM
jgi:hypothetical protein